MRDELDRRVIPQVWIDLVRSIQAVEPAHLAGGVALSSAHLAHRLSADIDLFVHDAETHRRTCRLVVDQLTSAGGSATVVQDAGSFWRCRATLAGMTRAFDVVHESIADLEPPPPAIDGVVVESLADLRAAKLTSLMSRSEPRDLVDLLFLDRAGYPPENDLRERFRRIALPVE